MMEFESPRITIAVFHIRSTSWLLLPVVDRRGAAGNARCSLWPRPRGAHTSGSSSCLLRVAGSDAQARRRRRPPPWPRSSSRRRTRPAGAEGRHRTEAASRHRTETEGRGGASRGRRPAGKSPRWSMDDASQLVPPWAPRLRWAAGHSTLLVLLLLSAGETARAADA
jgi:hypothetical protein